MRNLLFIFCAILVLSGCSREAEKVIAITSTEKAPMTEPETTQVELITEQENCNSKGDSNSSGSGDEIVLIDKWIAVTIDHVVFRSKPNRDSKAIEVNYSNELQDVHFNSFLKGMKLVVLGRSQNKDLINGMESYWYYVQYIDGEIEQQGWVYGKFIDLYDEGKESFYASELNDELKWLDDYCKTDDTLISAKEIRSRVDELIKRNIEAIGIFYQDSLPFYDPTQPDGAALLGFQYPVKSDKFKSFEDLKEFVYDTYEKVYANKMLYTWRDGSPMYLDVKGQLYVDSSKVGGSGYYVEWDNYSFDVTNISKDSADLVIYLTELEVGTDIVDDISKEGKLIKQGEEWVLESPVW